MIARDSKSYPYLAIAQHYNVPYEEVLNWKCPETWTAFGDWRFDVQELERAKRNAKQN